MFEKNKIIVVFFLTIVLTGGVFLARGSFDSNLPAEQLSESSYETELISAEIVPYKVKVGDIQATIVKIKDDIGIEKISAQIPFEGGYDEISLKLVEGDEKDGTWKGEWKAHNTKVKEYITKIIAINKEGKIRNTEASWWDDTETVWYDQNWTKRRKVTLTENSGSTLTNYQVKVTIAYDSDMQADFDDIRFTKDDGVTLLDHWRESYTASTTADFWVEVDSMTASTTTDVYYYYGNPSASSASNGTNTFEFFDDFSGDLSKWTTGGTNPNFAIVNGVLKQSDITDYRKEIYSTNYSSFSDNILEAKLKFDTADSTAPWEFDVRRAVIEDTYRVQFRDDTNDLWLIDVGDANLANLDGFTESTGVWRDYKLVVYDSGGIAYLELWVDGVQKLTGSDATPRSAGSIGLSMYGSVTYMDDIRIRKYISPEPTVGSAGVEWKKPSRGGGVSPSGGGAMMF